MPADLPAVRPLAPDDLPAAVRLGRVAFGGPPEPAPEPAPQPEPALARFGLFSGAGTLLATAAEWDQLQWFGGRAVPVSGVADVAVAPEARSGGLGGHVMRHLLGAARDRGAVVSTLFATAPQLYRGLGYEQVGSLTTWRLPTASLARVRRPDDVVLRAAVADEADTAAVAAVYGAVAEAGNGMAVRRAPRFSTDPDTVIGGRGDVTLGVGPDGDVEGYCRWQRGDGYGPEAVLTVRELVATTGRATQALLAMVGSWASVTPSVLLRLPGTDPVDLLLPERARDRHASDDWMLRVLDVDAALAARGWPAPVSGSVDLVLGPDGLFGEPARTCRLVLDGGTARLEPGGSGRLHLDRRGLAVWWSGYAGTSVLRRAGLLTGDDPRGTALLDVVSGPAPALLDYF